MARMYFGKTLMSPHTVDEREVAKVKFGVSVDNLLGNVDENGVYTEPTESFVLDLTGVKIIGGSSSVPNGKGLYYAISHNPRCLGVIADDLVGSKQRGCFGGICAYNTDIRMFEFNSLEEINAQEMFSSSNIYGYTKLVPHFNKLKYIKSHSASFQYAFNNAKIEPDETFPLLEYVSGDNQFSNFRKLESGDVIIFSKIKTIIGSASQHSGTFGSAYTPLVWKFPRATEFINYIWYVSSSYSGEIHFAKENQAAIEACEGYDYKWGNAGATIYFDLMLNIVVNGVAYCREHTIGGYTSWKDADGNVVYTDATAEPAVDTPVYSDQGTTQVGTVSEAT